jgi:hypothetical protein
LQGSLGSFLLGFSFLKVCATLFLVFLKCQWDLFDIAPYGILGPHKGLVFKPSGGANGILANLLPMN